jgi:hypothetical protein
MFLSDAAAYDALRYTLVMVEEMLAKELDDNRDSEETTLSLLDNLVEQLTLVDYMQKTLDTTPSLEGELLDENSRIAGEIQHVFDSARVRDMPIPEEIATKVELLLKL